MAPAILAVDAGNIAGAASLALLTLALVLVINRVLRARGHTMVGTLAGELSPVVDTRLRFLRRLAEATVVVIGGAPPGAAVTHLDKPPGAGLGSRPPRAPLPGFSFRAGVPPTGTGPR